jgi:hypothetical protein
MSDPERVRGHVMNRHAMGVIGAMLLAILAAGCAQQSDLSAVSAMPRVIDGRPDASALRVDLREILTP